MSKSRDQAYRYIKQAVLEGHFKPGERLIENKLVEKIGVSRTPIREAIKLLAADNYLVMRQNSGATVVNWSVDELSDIFKLRAITEGMIARRAADHITQDQIKSLQECIEKIDQLLTEGAPYNTLTFLEQNNQFHSILRSAANSHVLKQALERLISPPIVYQVVHNFTKQELMRSNSHHSEIVDSMIAGDGDWADHAMQAHVMSAYNRMREILNTNQD